jgi:hypothetical protein
MAVVGRLRPPLRRPPLQRFHLPICLPHLLRQLLHPLPCPPKLEGGPLLIFNNLKQQVQGSRRTDGGNRDTPH